jgi:translation initiation factor 5
MISENQDKIFSENEEIFLNFFQTKLLRMESKLLSCEDQDEIVQEAERLEIKDKAVYIISKILFNEDILNEIIVHKQLFLKFCSDNVKAQDYVLEAFKQFYFENYTNKNLIAKSMLILETLWDAEILEEETIMSWYQLNSDFCKNDLWIELQIKLEPFLKWLVCIYSDSDSADSC